MSQWNPPNAGPAVGETGNQPASGAWGQAAPSATPLVTPKKSNKKTIIIIVAIIGVLLTCCCCGTGLFFFFVAEEAPETYEDILKQIDDGFSLDIDGYDDSTDGRGDLPPELWFASANEAVTLDKVTFNIEPRVDGGVQSIHVTIENKSKDIVTIPVDGGWSGVDVNGNSLEYNWVETPAAGSESFMGRVMPGDTYQLTLIFTDSNLNPVYTTGVTAELDKVRDGYYGIFWSLD